MSFRRRGQIPNEYGPNDYSYRISIAELTIIDESGIWRGLYQMDCAPIHTRSSASTTQLVRYAIIGFITNTSAYVIYLLLTYFGFAPIVTMTCVYGIGATIGYLGNRTLTFSYKGGALGSGVRFILTYFAGYLINLSILLIFVNRLGYAHQIVQAIAIFVVAAFLFVGLKFFVFRIDT